MRFLTGWMAKLEPASSPAAAFQFDVFISAGGGRFVPDGETNTLVLLSHFHSRYKWQPQTFRKASSVCRFQQGAFVTPFSDPLPPFPTVRFQTQGAEREAGYRRHSQLRQQEHGRRGPGCGDQRRGPDLQPEVLPRPPH